MSESDGLPRLSAAEAGFLVRSLCFATAREASAAEKVSESDGLPRLSAAEAGFLVRSLCFATAREASAAEKVSESDGLPRLSAAEAGFLVRSLCFATAREASAAEKVSESDGLPRLSAAEAGFLVRSLCFATAREAERKGGESWGGPVSGRPKGLVGRKVKIRQGAGERGSGRGGGAGGARGGRPRLVLEGCTPSHQSAEPGEQQIIRVRYVCPTPPSALVIEDLPADLQVIATWGGRSAVLDANRPRFDVVGAPSSWVRFIFVGIEHILLGFDHLLFVLAFTLVVASRRRLVLALSGFTIGHTITLAVATLDWVQVPGPPTEAAIALSVVFLAAEAARGRPTLTSRHPGFVATAFGLLHGLGFAGALADLLPQTESVLGPLLGFNLGVELGQISFVIAVLGAVAVGRLALKEGGRGGPPTRSVATTTRRLAAWGTGCLAGFWVWDRVAAFFA